jgi:cytoskeletal protein RodZ
MTLLWLLLSGLVLLVSLGAFGVLMWRVVLWVREEQSAHDDLDPKVRAASSTASAASQAADDASTKDPVSAELSALESSVDALRTKLGALSLSVTEALDDKAAAYDEAATRVKGARWQALGAQLSESLNELDGKADTLQTRLNNILTKTSDRKSTYTSRANDAYAALKAVHSVLPTLRDVQALLLEGRATESQIRARLDEYLSTAVLTDIQASMDGVQATLSADLSARGASLATLNAAAETAKSCDALYDDAQALDARLNGSTEQVVAVSDALCFAGGASSNCLTGSQLGSKLATLAAA